MIIIDSALEQRRRQGTPVRVALVGAGFVGRSIALQIITSVPGLQLVAIANRTAEKAHWAYHEAGIADTVQCDTLAQLESAIDSGRVVVTQDPTLVCQAAQVEVVIEATGHVEVGTRSCHEAIRHGKHVVLMGAEIDASVGPILKRQADRAGVVYTYTDGDEPGVAMNLYRFLTSMGCRPRVMGQLKGFLDRYRNPDTQSELATRINQNPAVLASFADGTKLALEAALMGNATGFVPRVRGMQGYPCKHVDDLLTEFTLEDFAADGYVEYALGAAPHTGAFVICSADSPAKRDMLAYLKMGSGPLYMFYTPYHLPPWQVAHSVARAALFGDATIAPRGAPVCDAISYAKRDLKTGDVLDGVGGYACYGVVERYEVCRAADFLPVALSLDCRLTRDVAKDQPITRAMITRPPGRLCDELRDQQDRAYAPSGQRTTQETGAIEA